MKSTGIKSILMVVVMLNTLAFCAQGNATKGSSDQGQSKIRIGTLNLDIGNIDKKETVALQESIAQILTDLGFYKVYNQADLEHAFAGIKQQFPARCRDPRCVAALGTTLGLDRMLYGSIDKNKDRFGVSLYLIDVQSMQISQRVTLETEGNASASDLVKTAIYKLHGLTDEKATLKTHTYYGPEIHNERSALYASAAFIALSIGWAAANGTLTSYDLGHNFDSEVLSGISTSSLNVPISGRPSAMGNCYVAASDDAYGVLYNPAGMAWMQNSDIAVSYQSRFDQLNYFVASFASKGTREFGYGNAISFNRDYMGLQSELYFLSSYGYKFNQLLPFLRPFSIGATVKVINKTTPKTDDGSVSQNTLGAGLDVGFMTEFADHIRFGFLFKDIPTFEKVDNGQFRYLESYPPLLQVGGSYRAGYSTFLICEGQIPLTQDQRWKFGGGIEQEFFQIFLIRLGARKEVTFETPWILTGGFGTKVKTESFVGKYFILDGSYEYNTSGLFPVTNASLRIGF